MSVDQAPGVETDTADAVPPPAPAGRSGRRRRRRAEHRGRRRFLVVTGTALVAGAVWWLGWASPVTLVEHVVVDAPHGISEKAVRKASGIASATKASVGVNLIPVCLPTSLRSKPVAEDRACAVASRSNWSPSTV